MNKQNPYFIQIIKLSIWIHKLNVNYFEEKITIETGHIFSYKLLNNERFDYFRIINLFYLKEMKNNVIQFKL